MFHMLYIYMRNQYKKVVTSVKVSVVTVKKFHATVTDYPTKVKNNYFS